jgi:hypothetical protein
MEEVETPPVVYAPWEKKEVRLLCIGKAPKSSFSYNQVKGRVFEMLNLLLQKGAGNIGIISTGAEASIGEIAEYWAKNNGVECRVYVPDFDPKKCRREDAKVARASALRERDKKIFSDGIPTGVFVYNPGTSAEKLLDIAHENGVEVYCVPEIDYNVPQHVVISRAQKKRNEDFRSKPKTYVGPSGREYEIRPEA